MHSLKKALGDLKHVFRNAKRILQLSLKNTDGNLRHSLAVGMQKWILKFIP